MDKIITKLQKKSDHEKNTIAFGVAGFITVLLILFWVSNFGTTIGNTVKETSLADTSPLGFFEDNINKLFEFDKAKEKISGVVGDASKENDLNASVLSALDQLSVSSSSSNFKSTDVSMTTTLKNNNSSSTIENVQATTTKLIKKK